MIKEIRYTGISSSPSDYECPDGELSAMLDAVTEDGSVHPLFPPKTLFTLEENQAVKFIHKTSSYTHYIIQDDEGNVFWRDREKKPVNKFDTLNDILSFNAIGNTLIALCKDGMHYFLWKEDDAAYTSLGGEIPECPISFGLKAESKLYSKQNYGEENENGFFTITFDEISSDGICATPFTEENKRKITEQLLAKINKFINEEGNKKGKFIFPFFVRYAYRLYDGSSLSHHSAPILMIPSTKATPIAFWAGNPYVGNGSVHTSAEMDLLMLSCTLDYQPLITDEERKKLLQWSDIIKSVEIFISAPIYTYDQNGECTGIEVVSRNEYGMFVGKYNGGDSIQAKSETVTSAKTYYQEWDMNNIMHMNNGGFFHPYIFKTPAIPEADVHQRIKDCHTFYHLKSIDIGSLPTERTDIQIDESYLSALVTKEVMTDDYQTHDRLIPSYSYTYNSRLNIANIKRKLFGGFSIASMTPYVNGFMDYRGAIIGSETIADGNAVLESISLRTQINADGRSVVVQSASSPRPVRVILDWQKLEFIYRPAGYYMYYPDTSAKFMHFSDVLNGPFSLPLEAHTYRYGRGSYGRPR